MGSDCSAYFLAEDVNTKPPHNTFACLNKICPAAVPPYCPYICEKDAEEAMRMKEASKAGQLEITINGVFYTSKPEERERIEEPALVGV